MPKLRADMKSGAVKKTVLSLFSSAGIGELGVKAAGCDIVVSNELLARLSTFDLSFNFFHADNFKCSAIGTGFSRLSPRKAV